MSQIKMIVAMAVLVALTVFTVYLPKDLSSVSPMVILVSALFIGAVVSAVPGIAENLKLRSEIKKKNKETADLSEKITNLQLKIRELEEKTEEEPSDKSEDEQEI
ncbi:MAG: LapA family protein [Elusimicrobiota bacterium]|nr:LapA family protein [Elusimicrobiota bacterium]